MTQKSPKKKRNVLFQGQKLIEYFLKVFGICIFARETIIIYFLHTP